MSANIFEFITIQELSRLLNIPVGTIYYWTSKKQIPFIKFGRHIRFDYEKVLEHFKVGPSNTK